MTLDSDKDLTVVDFGAHLLETHVRRALEEAWRRSGGEPLSAADVLRACLAIGSSPAFTALRNLLPQMFTPPEQSTPRVPFDPNSVELERPLADSYYLATSFLATSDKMIWGRDLVTMALLTRDDPSLQAFVAEASTTVDDLRDKWLYFLRDSGQHRTTEEWDQWWLAAGVSTAESFTPTAIRPAYLLTWNPGRYSESQMSELISNRAADGSVTFGWSSGNNRSMAVGDRVFLLRQGREPRGLVGIGTVSEPPKETGHWDQSS